MAAVQVSSASDTTTEYADIDQKALELRAVVQQRVAHLEQLLHERNAEVDALRRRLRQIEEDYKYNLSLIGQRDAALAEAMGLVQSMRHDMRSKTTRVTELEEACSEAHAQLQHMRESAHAAAVENDASLSQLRRKLDEQVALADAQRRALLASFEEERERSRLAFRSKLAQEESCRMRLLEKIEAEATVRSDHSTSHIRELQASLRHAEEQAAAAVKARESAEAAVVRSENRQKLLEEQLAEHSARRQALECAVIDLRTSHETKMRALVEEWETRIRSEHHVAANACLSGLSARSAESLARRRISELEAEQTRSESQFRSAAKDLEDRCFSLMSDIQAQLDAEREKRHTCEAERDLLRTQLSDARTNKASTAAADLSLRDERRELERRCAVLEDELERTRQTVEETQRRAEAATARCDALATSHQRDVDALRATIALRDAAVSEAREERLDASRAWEATARQLRGRIRELEAAIETTESDARAGLREQLRKVERLEQERDTLQARCSTLKDANAQILEQVDSMTRDMESDRLVVEANEAVARANNLQRLCDEKTSEITILRRTLADRESEMLRYQRDIMDRRDADISANRLREDNAQLRDELQRCKQNAEVLASYDSSSAANRLLHESELWRMKAYQSEEALRRCSAERDGLMRELDHAQSVGKSLEEENAVLMEVNNMLRDQVRSMCTTQREIVAAQGIAEAAARGTSIPSSAPPMQIVDNSVQTHSSPSPRQGSAASQKAHPDLRVTAKPIRRETSSVSRTSGIVRRGRVVVRHYGVQ